jgi:large subunit ribosomal protein L28e
MWQSVADPCFCSRIYKAVADHVGKNSYRSDLNQHAVARASAIKLSQKEKKETPQQKPRGRRAKQLVAEKE